MLDRYVKTRPLAVMTRLILNEVMTDELDAVFHRHRQQGYERELLFSHLAQAISEVVLGFCETPNQAYNKLKEATSWRDLQFEAEEHQAELERLEASLAEIRGQGVPDGVVDSFVSHLDLVVFAASSRSG